MRRWSRLVRGEKSAAEVEGSAEVQQVRQKAEAAIILGHGWGQFRSSGAREKLGKLRFRPHPYLARGLRQSRKRTRKIYSCTLWAMMTTETPNSPQAVREQIEAAYRAESRRVLATLIRVLGDFDLAEEALHDAFASAMEHWPRDGVPSNPRAWLVSAGRFKAIDAMRRRARFDASLKELAERLDDQKSIVPSEVD